MSYHFFTERDFQNASPSCKMSDMEPHFLHRLDIARFHAEVPFIINSAARTEEHEKRMGRDGTSSHCKGIAVDLKATNSRTRSRILYGLRKAGFTRIGIGRTFIHVDDDPAKDQDVTWHYYPKEKNDHFGI